MDWCWDVIEKYRNNQGFANTIDNTAINTLTQAITTLTTTFTQTISVMQQDITTIKEQQLQAQKQIPKKEIFTMDKTHVPKIQVINGAF